VISCSSRSTLAGVSCSASPEPAGDSELDMRSLPLVVNRRATACSAGAFRPTGRGRNRNDAYDARIRQR
ncbi:hypothetical protein, partial [Azotobacter vinelandii]|uniref:hypothetical protein n=1 Tax=Azotobacter vinelandii TaxID=354 RepID=UPI001E4CF3FB